jgi:hypothetical protein
MKFSVGTGVVAGADHRHVDRPGQDAVAVHVTRDHAVAVVCDGCGSAPGSQVGAARGARLFAGARAERRARGAAVGDQDAWAAARADVIARLTTLLDGLPGDRDRAIHELLLFTVVAAAISRDAAIAVWAVGDGAYAIGDRAHVLGPFDDNRPPYIGYDLLGCPPEPHAFAATADVAGVLIIGTDGASALSASADHRRELCEPSRVAHRDGVRRYLAVRARTPDRIDWDERRVIREPAALRDDAAVAVIRWEPAS